MGPWYTSIILGSGFGDPCGPGMYLKTSLANSRENVLKKPLCVPVAAVAMAGNFPRAPSVGPKDSSINCTTPGGSMISSSSSLDSFAFISCSCDMLLFYFK
jgi:hypothetical protein